MFPSHTFDLNTMLRVNSIALLCSLDTCVSVDTLSSNGFRVIYQGLEMFYQYLFRYFLGDTCILAYGNSPTKGCGWRSDQTYDAARR